MKKYFNLPASNYEILCRIIGACANFRDRLIIPEIAEKCHFNPVIIINNMGFLTSLGIVLGGMSKSLTPNGRSLASAIRVNDLDDVKDCWHRIFFECAKTKLIASVLEVDRPISKKIVMHRVALTLDVALDFQNIARMTQLLDVLTKTQILREQADNYVFLNFEHRVFNFQNNVIPLSDGAERTKPYAVSSNRADFFGTLAQS